MKFKKGDLVVLKNGGPLMTVHEIGDYSDSDGPADGAICVWFTESGKPMQEICDTDSLVLGVPEKPTRT